MVVSKTVEVKISSSNFKFYKELGYKFEHNNDIIKVKLDDLSKGSHTKIELMCDYCGETRKIAYRSHLSQTKDINKHACAKCQAEKIKDVCMFKYGVKNPFQSEEVKNKTKITLQEKHGADHPMHSDEIKNRMFATNIKKYGSKSPNASNEVQKKAKKKCLEDHGVEHITQLPIEQEKRKKTRIINGNQLPDHLIKPYKLYRRKVDNISDRIKSKLLELWDGYDYYDGEYIKENFNLIYTDRKYPTMDHKISVLYGFLNGVPVEEIAKIENLCFTKHWINSTKCGKCENDFKL